MEILQKEMTRKKYGNQMKEFLFITHVLAFSWLAFSCTVKPEDAFLAARTGDISTVRKFIEASQGNIAVKDEYDRTLLHIAAWQGQEEVAEYLLVNKADLNGIAKIGMTPLMLALSENNSDIAILLINSGADLNSKNQTDNNYSALNYAANKGMVDVVNLLLDKGMNIEETSGNHETTPLMWAAYYGQVGSIKVLLDRGARINVQGTRGYTPLDLATSRRFPEAADYLLMKGGKYNMHVPPTGKSQP